MCAFRLSRAIWKIQYRIKPRIIKLTLNSVSPISKGDGNTHIYSYFITLRNYSHSKFENKIGKTVSPPNHLTASLYFFFCSFFSMKQLWLLAGAHRGILELEAEGSGWKHQNPPFMCFPFNRYIFPIKENLLNKIEWGCPHHGWQQLNSRFLPTAFLLPDFYLVLPQCSLKCWRLSWNLC